jgi:hypothetical protein
MQVMTQFSVFLINKPGVLAGVAVALAKAHVNLTALTLMDSLEHGVMRMVCKDAEGARKVLGKTHDRWSETDVLVVELENRPGVFAQVAKKLADAHINISYAYVTGGAGDGRTTAVFKVADLKKARKVLAPVKPPAKDKRAARTVRKSRSKKA